MAGSGHRIPAVQEVHVVQLGHGVRADRQLPSLLRLPGVQAVQDDQAGRLFQVVQGVLN